MVRDEISTLFIAPTENIGQEKFRRTMRWKPEETWEPCYALRYLGLREAIVTVVLHGISWKLKNIENEKEKGNRTSTMPPGDHGINLVAQ